MKTMIAIFACLLMAAGLGTIARAGVVIDEQVTTTEGSGTPVTHNLQEFVQGHKKKMVTEHDVFVIDLDKNTVMIIDPRQKVYAERALPPPGASSPHRQLDLNFKKTGKSSKVAGYACQMYTGAGKTPMAEVSAEGCFSTSAPGAAEISAFDKAAKGMAPSMPSGIPLTLVSTSKLNANFSVPGITPDQAAKLKAMMAKRGPQTTRKVVTKITMRDLPADTFAPPAGYERRTAGSPPPGAAGAQTPPPGAKSPE
jgi:Domain of unknown function (DUF4412)